MAFIFRPVLPLLSFALACALASAPVRAETPLPVRTAPLKTLIIHPQREAPATAVSLNDARISAQIGGIIRQIPIQVGDSVDPGQLLAQLDCTDHELSRDEAKAALAAAQARYGIARDQADRAEKLSRTKSISQEHVKERQAQAAAAKAEVARLTAMLNAAQRQVTECDIRAPFKAVVVRRIASVGELAMPGTPIARILDKNNVEISAKVQEQDLKSLRNAPRILFVSRERSYPLRLRTILPLVESKIRSYEVRLTFTGRKSPPGAAGRVQWTLPENYLPADLLVSRGGNLGVFSDRSGHARFNVLPNAQEGRPAEIALPGDTSIVLDGRFSLHNGQPIRVVKP